MTLHRILGGSAAAICFSLPALADVTAADVWQDWKALYESYGYTVTATESASGNAIALRDVTLSFAPEEGASVTATIPVIDLVGQSDGTVSITMSDSMPLTFSAEDGMAGALTMTTVGMVTTVSGTPGNLSYAYSGDSVTLAVTQLIDMGEAVQIDTISGTLNAFEGTTTSTLGTMRETAQSLRAASIGYVIKVPENSDNGAGVDLTGTLTGLELRSDATLPPGKLDVTDMAAAMAGGMRVDVNVTHAGSQTDFAIPGPDGASGNSKNTSGALRLAMLDGAVTWEGKSQGMQLNVMMNAMPLPFEASMVNSGFNVTVPLDKAEAPQDFAFGVTLEDLTLSDMVWAMLDPTGALPRDPATLVIDLAGKATVLHSVTDPANAMQAPGQFEELAIRDLVLRLAGAELTGKGGFTFDNTDMSTIPGMPRPTGAVDLKLVGGNALLDRLIAMGLLPQEQAMGARMMMGLFAVVTGDDTLTSKIEVNEQGHVLANGQRLQ